MRIPRTTIGPTLTLALGLLAVAPAAAPGADPLRWTLDNGLRVRLVPLAGQTEVAVVLGVRGGIWAEPSGAPHLAHLAEHLVFHDLPVGSPEAAAVARWAEKGHANGETLPGWMYFDLQVDPAELPLALRVQADRLARPQFQEATLRREIPRTLAEIDFVEQAPLASPSKFAISAFVQAALHDRGQVPIRARTRTLTLDEVRRYHAANFRPDRAILLVVGGFDPEPTRRAIADAFGPILPTPGASPLPHSPRPGPRVATWDVNTRHLVIAWPSPPPPSPEHAALTLAGSALQRRLATDPAILRLAKTPDVSTEVEGLLVINVALKPTADGAAVQARVLARVAELATPEGFTDRDCRGEQQAVREWVSPAPFRLALASLGRSPLGRTNAELRLLGRELAWGDLPTYARVVEGLDGPGTRAMLARLLAVDRAIVVRVEPRQ